MDIKHEWHDPPASRATSKAHAYDCIHNNTDQCAIYASALAFNNDRRALWMCILTIIVTCDEDEDDFSSELVDTDARHADCEGASTAAGGRGTAFGGRGRFPHSGGFVATRVASALCTASNSRPPGTGFAVAAAAELSAKLAVERAV